MHLTLLRHTAVASPKGLCYGHLDVALADSYDDERQRILQRMTDTSFSHIFASPSQRCLRLAEDLNRGRVCIDARLKELDFGAWEGRLWSSITPEESGEWTEDFVNRAPPQGETYAALALRFQDFLQDLYALRCPAPLVVTHSGVIRAAICMAAQRSLHTAFEDALDFGSSITLKLMPSLGVTEKIKQ